MTRARDKHLARLTARRESVITAADRRREALQAQVAIGVVLRRCLARLDIDPARLTMLRVCDAAAAELAAMPAARDGVAPSATGRTAGRTGKEQNGAPVGEAAGAAVFDARLMAMTENYRNGCDLDLGKASLAEALAWCVAQLSPRDRPEQPTAHPPED